MRKYYEGDTGGNYLVGALGVLGVGYFADVQTITQAADAAKIWWSLTGDDGGVIIRERDGGIVKVMWREADKDEPEMTDKEKIIEIVAPYVSAYGDDEAIANAIITAGFRREK